MRFVRRLFIPCACLVLCSCAGYRLGPTGGQQAGEKTIQVVPFSNQTLEPRLADWLTENLRRQLQQDGTFRLATHEAGDIIVSGTITKFERVEQSLAHNDVATVQDYRLNMTARVTARDRVTEKIILDQPVTGHALIRVGNDLVSAERQSLPILASDLAKNITALLVDGSW